MNNLFNHALDKYKKLLENKAARKVIMAMLGIVLVFGLVFQNVFTASAGVTTIELLPQPDAGLNSTGTVWANWNQTTTGGTWTINQGYTTAGWYVTTDGFDPTGTAIGSWRSRRGSSQDTLQTASIWHTFTVPAAYNSASDTLIASFYWKKLIGNNNVTASNVKWKVIRDSDQVEMGSGTLNSATAANTNINWTQQNVDLKTGLTTPVSAGVTYRLWLGHESRVAGFTSSDVAFDVARVTLTSTQVPTTVNVASSKAVIKDDNVDSATVTADVYDQFGQPINAQTVNFTRSPAVGSFSAGSAATDSNGRASVTYKANNDGGSNVTLTATAGSASAQTTVSVLTPQTLTAGASPTAVPNDNSTTSTITVQLKDNNGDPMSGEQVNFSTNLGTLSAASATTDGSGNASVTLKSGTGGTATVTAAVNRKPAVTASANVSVLAPTTLTISASPAAIPNDNTTTTTITVHLDDQNGAPMSGELLNLSTNLGTLSAATGTTNASGNVTVTLKSGSAGTATVTGSVDRVPGVTNTVAVTVIAPEPTTLSVSASPSYVIANDTDTATVTVHLVDQISSPLDGETINFTTDRGTLSVGSAVTDASGNASVTVKSATAGTATITATAASKPTVSNTATVNFYTAVPTTLTMTRSSAAVPNNNVSTSTIRAHLLDQNGYSISGRQINFSTNLGTLSAASAVTNASGDAEVTIRSASDGTATVTGSVDGAAGVTSSTTIFFAAPAPSTITVSASPNMVPADNSTTSAVSVHVTDQFGNPVIGETVNFSTNRGTISAASALTDGSGDAAVTIRSGTASPATVSAAAASKPSVNGVVSVVFTVPDVVPPVFIKAEATSKQIVYLTFDEAIKDPNTAGSTISVSGGMVVQQVYLMEDARIVRLLLSTLQGTGNQYPTPLSYTVNVTNIKDISNNNLASAAHDFEAFTPHGKYAPNPVTSGNSNRICGQCHSAHSSVGNGLLNGLTIKKVCFICHGIAGTSIYKVENEFYNWDDANVAAAVYSTSLHKALDADSPGYDLLTCVDCHDPHGTRRPGTNDIFPKLLSARNVNGAVYTSDNGNWFCLACHGFGDANAAYQNRLGAYWNGTGGLHDWGMTVASGVYYGVHYDNRLAALQPASGTNITCVLCHERHGSTYNALKDHNRADNEEGQCYKCHGDDANYSMTAGYNVYNKITSSVSQHKVGSTGYGKIECTGCHGPHTVANAKYNAGQAYSAISDPDNTKNVFNQSSGAFSEFCLKCHDGAPPGATTNAAAVIPFTVTFVDPGFSTNDGGWDKNSFIDSGHYNNAQLSGQTDTYGNRKNECSLCHEWHGTPYKWLVVLDEDKNGADGICLQCHKSGTGYSAPAGVTSLDIKTQLNATYSHPTIKAGYSGRHSNTENYNGVAETTANRHAQCYDCHDPHTVKASSGEVDKPGNVSGVKFGTTAWNSWNSATATPLYLDSTTNNRQAYLCYKCHSKYAYGGSPPNPTPSSSSGYGPGAFAQTDVAMEFNPSNKARHVVEGTSQMPTFTYNSVTYYYGKFVNGWTATSAMRCTDCHMPATGAKGPHGSSNRFILKAAWNPTQSATMTSSDLCFFCHDYQFYYGGGDTGSNTVRSQFSGGSLGFNGHASKHQSGKQKNCSNCHGGLPHGWKYTDSAGNGQALWSSTDARPYKDGSYLGDIPTNATRAPEQWTSGHSGTSCGNTGGCT